MSALALLIWEAQSKLIMIAIFFTWHLFMLDDVWEFHLYCLKYSHFQDRCVSPTFSEMLGQLLKPGAWLRDRRRIQEGAKESGLHFGCVTSQWCAWCVSVSLSLLFWCNGRVRSDALLIPSSILLLSSVSLSTFISSTSTYANYPCLGFWVRKVLGASAPIFLDKILFLDILGEGRNVPFSNPHVFI
jgi:hypothetical protein